MTTRAALGLNDVIFNTLRGKRVEPEQRLVGGRFGYAVHRFPIKGGISLADVMVDDIWKHNALIRRLNGGIGGYG